MPLHHTIQI